MYDGDEPSVDAVRQSIEGSSADSDVRERLVRLEKLMEMMMLRESEGVATRRSTGFDVAIAKNTLTHLTQRPSISPSPSQAYHAHSTSAIEALSAPVGPVGQIVFKELHSAYFDSDFWAGLVTEVNLWRLGHVFFVDFTDLVQSRLRI
jgi:hypothetical protein